MTHPDIRAALGRERQNNRLNAAAGAAGLDYRVWAEAAARASGRIGARRRRSHRLSRSPALDLR